MGAYAGVVVLAGLLFYFFNPAGAGDCSFNISAITMTLVLALVVSAVSMLPYVRPRRVAGNRSCHDASQNILRLCSLACFSWLRMSLAWHHSQDTCTSLLMSPYWRFHKCRK